MLPTPTEGKSCCQCPQRENRVAHPHRGENRVAHPHGGENRVAHPQRGGKSCCQRPQRENRVARPQRGKNHVGARAALSAPSTPRGTSMHVEQNYLCTYIFFHSSNKRSFQISDSQIEFKLSLDNSEQAAGATRR